MRDHDLMLPALDFRRFVLTCGFFGFMFGCPQANADGSIRTFRCGENEIKIGIRVLNNGQEIFRTCQDGFRVEQQTGFVRITNRASPDLLLVTQVGAKVSEAILYRKMNHRYRRVAWWSGWLIQPRRWHGEPALEYQQYMPTVEHPKHSIYFVWNGHRVVASEPGDYSFQSYSQ
jgi:hypothetical protein